MKYIATGVVGIVCATYAAAGTIYVISGWLPICDRLSVVGLVSLGLLVIIAINWEE